MKLAGTRCDGRADDSGFHDAPKGQHHKSSTCFTTGPNQKIYASRPATSSRRWAGVIDSGSSGLRTTTLLPAPTGESVGAALGGPYASRGRRGSRPVGMHPQRPPPHGRAAVWCSRRGRQWRLLHYRPTGNVSKASSPTPGRNRNGDLVSGDSHPHEVRESSGLAGNRLLV